MSGSINIDQMERIAASAK